MTRGRVMASVVLVIAALALAGCRADGLDTGDKGYVSGDGTVEQIPAAERRKVVPIAGRLPGGGTYDSTKHRGQVVVYNVWGSWCPPCREEAPALRRVWHQTRDQDVQFIGINVRDNDAAARSFERKYHIEYPSVMTADSGGALLSFGPALPPSAVPSTVVVDQKGRMAARILGAVTYGTLSTLVEETLGETG